DQKPENSKTNSSFEWTKDTVQDWTWAQELGLVEYMTARLGGLDHIYTPQGQRSLSGVLGSLQAL
ncbi:10352_t:CDS:1, partial [Acaulospora colombiana]